MAFQVYISRHGGRSAVEAGWPKFSDALLNAKEASTLSAVEFTAVLNRSRNTLAIYSDGNLVDLMSADERAAVSAGKCRRASEGCPSEAGPMNYCVDHFHDLVISGHPGGRETRPPESLEPLPAGTSPATGPGRPRSLDEVRLARGYEVLDGNEDATAKDLAKEFDVTTTTIYRWFPQLRRPDVWRGRRLSDAAIERGERLHGENPDINASAMADALKTTITTIRKYFPDVRDGRQALTPEQFKRAEELIQGNEKRPKNERYTIKSLAKEMNVAESTIRKHFPHFSGTPRLGREELLRGRKMARSGSRASELAKTFEISLSYTYQVFGKDLRAVRESQMAAPKGWDKRESRASGRARQTGRKRSPKSPADQQQQHGQPPQPRVDPGPSM
jgi:hypothetical protein